FFGDQILKASICHCKKVVNCNTSNASTILFVVSASVLMRGLPGGLIFCILPVSSSRFLHFPTVDGCNAINLHVYCHMVSKSAVSFPPEIPTYAALLENCRDEEVVLLIDITSVDKKVLKMKLPRLLQSVPHSL
ncbi:hypothetical protein L9F63_018304, partial [Diploptera punctata]